MTRKCQMTGKKPVSGNNRPFSLKATKRTFKPNIFTKKMYNPETGKVEKMKLSAKAIKTLKKWARLNGKEETFKAEKVAATHKKGEAHAAGEGKHVKNKKLTPKQKKELEAKKEEEAKEAAKSKVDKEIEAADKAE